MNVFNDFLMGLSLASTPSNLLFAFIGCLFGTLIGVLPGIGPLATISVLLSLTISLDPLSSLIMLSGIYYGAQYGGSTTAILCNLPGEATSVITCIDGNKMALQGRAGAALATAALSSLFAGVLATLVIILFAPPLSEIALSFNSPEYFSLMTLGLMSSVILSPGRMIKALSMACLGLILGTVGTDFETGDARYTFGLLSLYDGIGIIGLVMGLFGLAEIVRNLSSDEKRSVVAYKWRELWLTWSEFRQAWPAALRGTVVGSILGVLPGGGLALAPFASYSLEKRLSRTPDRFGNGAIEGVASPEAANNASAQTSFIPLLTLGIPSNAIIALMLGAMIMQGIQPGPDVIIKRPDLFWGLVASMLIGNFMLVVINLPLVGLWVKLLRIPYQLLFPSIVVFCCIGAYTASGNAADLFFLFLFCIAGIILSSLNFQLIPLLLGFILGPLAEENLRRAIALAHGDLSTILHRPISVVLLLATLALILVSMTPKFRARKLEFVDVD